MSVVVAKVFKDKIIIGADSQTSYYWRFKSTDGLGARKNDGSSKIIQINDMVIAGVGYGTQNSFMQLFARNHKPKGDTVDDVMEFLAEFESWGKSKDNTFKLYNDFLIVFNKKLFRTWDDFLVDEIHKFTAIGSGMESAITALYLGHDVKESLEIASKLTLYCSKPIQIYEIPLINSKQHGTKNRANKKPAKKAGRKSVSR